MPASRASCWLPISSSAIVPSRAAGANRHVGDRARHPARNPEDASDALFATDNTQAGRFNGQYAKAALGDAEAKIAMLNGTAATVSEQRRNGFLEGFGITADDPQVVCQADTNGINNRARPRRWRTA